MASFLPLPHPAQCFNKDLFRHPIPGEALPADGVGLAGDLGAQGFGVRQPRLDHRRRHAVVGEGLAQDLGASRELPPHDPMTLVGDVKGPAAVGQIAAKKTRRQLPLALGQPLEIDVAKEEADHGVPGNPRDEVVDDAAQDDGAAQGFQE